MTVAEMIEKLKTMPQDAEVVMPFYEDDYTPATTAKLCEAVDQTPDAYRGPIFIKTDSDIGAYMAYHERKKRAPVVLVDYS